MSKHLFLVLTMFLHAPYTRTSDTKQRPMCQKTTRLREKIAPYSAYIIGGSAVLVVGATAWKIKNHLTKRTTQSLPRNYLLQAPLATHPTEVVTSADLRTVLYRYHTEIYQQHVADQQCNLFARFAYPVTSIHLDEEGNTLITTTNYNDNLSCIDKWNLGTTNPVQQKAVQHTIDGATYNPHAHILTTFSNNNALLRTYNANTMQSGESLNLASVIRGKELQNFGTSRNGSKTFLELSSQRGGQLQVYNTQTKSLLRQMPFSHDTPVFNHDRSYSIDLYDGTLCNVHTGEQTQFMETQQTEKVPNFLGAAFSKDSSHLALLLPNQTINIVNLDTRKHVCTINSCDRNIHNWSFSPDSNFLMTAHHHNEPHKNASINIWSTQTGECLGNVATEYERIAHINMSTDNSAIMLTPKLTQNQMFSLSYKSLVGICALQQAVPEGKQRVSLSASELPETKG